MDDAALSLPWHARDGHLTKGGKGIAPAQVRRYLERLDLVKRRPARNA